MRPHHALVHVDLVLILHLMMRPHHALVSCRPCPHPSTSLMEVESRS
jgi:hypothetical protein